MDVLGLMHLEVEGHQLQALPDGLPLAVHDLQLVYEEHAPQVLGDEQLLGVVSESAHCGGAVVGLPGHQEQLLGELVGSG